MNWNKDKSIVLSMICTLFFALLLVALDIVIAFSIVPVSEEYGMPLGEVAFLAAAGYIASGLLYVVLYQLWRLLRRIREGSVFSQENVASMRLISWCCFAVAAVSAVCAVYLYFKYIIFWYFLVIAMAAGFMGLIVRIVKNVFQQAIAMKSELDLTV